MPSFGSPESFRRAGTSFSPCWPPVEPSRSVSDRPGDGTVSDYSSSGVMGRARWYRVRGSGECSAGGQSHRHAVVARRGRTLGTEIEALVLFVDTDTCLRSSTCDIEMTGSVFQIRAEWARSAVDTALRAKKAMALEMNTLFSNRLRVFSSRKSILHSVQKGYSTLREVALRSGVRENVVVSGDPKAT